MRQEIGIALAMFIGAMPLAAAPAEPDATARGVVRLIVGVEQHLAKHDLKGYCAAMYGTPDYAKAVAIACNIGVKNKVRKPEDCSDAILKQDIEKAIGSCVSMTREQFDKTVKLWDEVRRKFLAEMAAKGVDGEKTLKEERAKLR